MYPFDDVHRFHRPAALVASAQKKSVEEALRWLAPDPRESGWSQAELNSFKAHGIKPPVRIK